MPYEMLSLSVVPCFTKGSRLWSRGGDADAAGLLTGV